jgi:hypothetical protein
MKFRPVGKLNTLIIFIVLCMLVACNSAAERTGTASSDESQNAESGTPAMVDVVTVTQIDNHYYGIVNGFYPDTCTKVSSLVQSVEDTKISITLLTDKPAGLLCAAMLTPFTIEVLLTTGGLVAQEYSVVVNDGPMTTFNLEY